MRKRALCAALVLVAGAAVPAVALAKGPSSASISGPGLDDPIRLTGDGEDPGSALGALSEAAGFAPAVFGHRDPDPMRSQAPADELGPRYTVLYVMRGPDGLRRIEQDVYPYAKPHPVTYMRPGQPVPAYGFRTYGGWFQSGGAEAGARRRRATDRAPDRRRLAAGPGE